MQLTVRIKRPFVSLYIKIYSGKGYVTPEESSAYRQSKEIELFCKEMIWGLHHKVRIGRK